MSLVALFGFEPPDIIPKHRQGVQTRRIGDRVMMARDRRSVTRYENIYVPFVFINVLVMYIRVMLDK